MTAEASVANATPTISASAIAAPAITPRIENRAPSVITGIASQASRSDSIPAIATLAAITTSAPTQAAKRTCSGRSTRVLSRAPSANTTAAPSSGASVHQPSQWVPNSAARARIASVARRSGARRRSMSSIRSRSAGVGHSHEPSCSTTGIREARFARAPSRRPRAGIVSA